MGEKQHAREKDRREDGRSERGETIGNLKWQCGEEKIKYQRRSTKVKMEGLGHIREEFEAP